MPGEPGVSPRAHKKFQRRTGGFIYDEAEEKVPMYRSKNGHLRLADRLADYKSLGIDPVEIAQFEDGQRIGTETGCYEWSYLDAHLDNGATIVVVFYPKPNVSPNGPLAPRITINITLPDGRSFEKFLDTRPSYSTHRSPVAMSGSGPIASSAISIATTSRQPSRRYRSIS